MFPSDCAVKAIGADGYAAALVSYAMLALWFAGTLLGHHDALARRYPVRVTLACMWAVTIASFVLMHRTSLTSEQLLSAARRDYHDWGHIGDTREYLRRKLPALQDDLRASGAVPIDARQPVDQVVDAILSRALVVPPQAKPGKQPGVAQDTS